MTEKKKYIIGWAEYVDLPDWGISHVKAKIDTGAKTSAIHVDEIKRIGHGRVRFTVVLCNRTTTKRVTMEAPVTRWAEVRSSAGHLTKRPFVKTRARLGDVEKEIELSLISRHHMKFRMLLGRTALEDDFVVDVSRRTNESRKPQINQLKENQNRK